MLLLPDYVTGMALSDLRTEDSHHANIVLFGTKNSTYLSAMQSIHDNEPVVAVDTEGVDLGAAGPMTLIQVIIYVILNDKILFFKRMKAFLGMVDVDSE